MHIIQISDIQMAYIIVQAIIAVRWALWGPRGPNELFHGAPVGSWGLRGMGPMGPRRMDGGRTGGGGQAAGGRQAAGGKQAHGRAGGREHRRWCVAGRLAEHRNINWNNNIDRRGISYYILISFESHSFAFKPRVHIQ